jgi:cytochrome c6
MKTLVTLSATTLLGLCFANSALAADAEAGKKIFMNNCTGCHNNGMNVIVPEKTLKKADLEKNTMYSDKAIINQVTQGKSPMPAFGSQLSASDIENVAAYVLKQADSGWK